VPTERGCRHRGGTPKKMQQHYISEEEHCCKVKVKKTLDWRFVKEYQCTKHTLACIPLHKETWTNPGPVAHAGSMLCQP